MLHQWYQHYGVINCDICWNIPLKSGAKTFSNIIYCIALYIRDLLCLYRVINVTCNLPLSNRVIFKFTIGKTEFRSFSVTWSLFEIMRCKFTISARSFWRVCSSFKGTDKIWCLWLIHSHSRKKKLQSYEKQYHKKHNTKRIKCWIQICGTT